jgi:hypothetical protein
MQRVLQSRGFPGLKEKASRTLMLLLHAQPAAECEAALSAQLRALRVFVHFPLLAPDPSDGNRVDNIDDAPPGINVAIAELMVMCSCPLPVCREHVRAQQPLRRCSTSRRR